MYVTVNVFVPTLPTDVVNSASHVKPLGNATDSNVSPYVAVKPLGTSYDGVAWLTVIVTSIPVTVA